MTLDGYLMLVAHAREINLWNLRDPKVIEAVENTRREDEMARAFGMDLRMRVYPPPL